MNLSNYGFMLIVLLLLCYTLLTVIDRVIQFPGSTPVGSVTPARAPVAEVPTAAVPLPAPVINWARPRNGFVPPPPPVPVY